MSIGEIAESSSKGEIIRITGKFKFFVSCIVKLLCNVNQQNANFSI